MGSLIRSQTMIREGAKGTAHAGQRLDIQGLRMVAVLLVLVFHAWGWPRGGFVGVDVFFVISGFLITGNLLRTAERTGNVSFKKFYWNRVRRIVPAATVVLILTVLMAALVFQSGRFRQVSWDALSAFFFMSNWRFALRDTDYFGQFELVSPVQHYWSLSIEEQFYFVWPALIFVLWLIETRRARSAGQTLKTVRFIFIAVVVASFAWACSETISAPTWAYFNTLSRAWELALGAVLAASAGALGRIRTELRPWLSWAGLGLILAGALLISEQSAGFPAPWALLPVAGSALVIAAGVGEEPAGQMFLRNRASVYVGDISYSLYLVHWPIIVFLGTISTPGSVVFSVAVLALSFGLAIASYHFIENPLRYIDRDKFRNGIGKVLNPRSMRSGELLSMSGRYSAAAALTMVTLGLSAIALDPARYYHAQPRETAGSSTSGKASPTRDSGLAATPATTNGPATAALQQEISAALVKADWPALDPSLDTMINDPIPAMATISGCGRLEPELDPGTCWFGSTTA
ncbi:acyltransferase, partial [Mycolicibacterium sp.]|uniref:acyltransferase family protein n=1 Tax=Mycolicibacterium sp. TaxID=2320850 RepID=UPI0028A6F333